MGGTHQKLSFLDGSGSKRVAELNLDAANGHKDVRDGLAGEGRGLSDEDETRINDTAMDLNEGHVLEAATVAHITVREKLQHQSLAPIVRWERFLPLRTLKVLLVENDDSTRQVLSALLRNCCYEVTAVANGLEAWRILLDLTNHIDLVLTEVVMPGWSGIGLLCKIMSHKTCKTIPVIMMSSNDSMGIVFKCLSKGAVDFLVKPIRKNELKNLWQHVWRRCHSSSGSASESGIQGQKCTKSKSEDDSANNTGSNDEEDIGNIGLSARDGSDNGSGTQSSWTKRPFEADSPQAISPSEQESVPHDSTCAHVIHPAPDASLYGNNMPANMPANAGAGHKEQKKIAVDDNITASDPGNESNQTDKVSTKLTGPSTEKSPADNLPPKDADDDTVRRTNLNNTLNEPTTTRPPHPPTLNSSQNNDHGAAQLPSLKRLRSTATPSTDERNVVLKHSSQSAFSRYPASATSVVRRNSVPDNQCSNGSPGISKDASASAFRRVQSQGSAMQEKIDGADVAPAKGSLKQVQVQHHHHHYHHYHHHIHALQPRPEQDCSSVEKLEANAANYSNSGSNHGSDGQNGCSAVVNAGGTNMESAAGGVAAKGGAGGAGGGGGGGGDGACQNRFGQREAALNKFRQKRKERNFAKKVRYHSRKRLAEQRPRVRGQFVRRATRSENRDEDS